MYVFLYIMDIESFKICVLMITNLWSGVWLVDDDFDQNNFLLFLKILNLLLLLASRNCLEF
jgi:hypothetical protein